MDKNRWTIFYSLLFIGAGLMVLGIIFSRNPAVGYSFMGVGILLQIISVIILRMGKK